MASFVIHHIAGVKFLENLEKIYNINLTNEEKNNFLMGNLIVDSVKTEVRIPEDSNEEEAKNLRRKFSSIIQNEKRLTHFRDINDCDLIVQKPKVDDFVSKYYRLITKDITALGYLFHLYTDKMFFGYLFNETFECLDKDNNPTIYINNANTVRVKKNNTYHNLSDFFNHNYQFSIYKDYTTINKILLENYNISFNEKKLLEYVVNFINPGIEEVDYSKIISVLNKTNNFINESYNNKENNLNIFDLDIIKNFINVVLDNFIEDYDYLLNRTNNILSKKR